MSKTRSRLPCTVQTPMDAIQRCIDGTEMQCSGRFTKINDVAHHRSLLRLQVLRRAHGSIRTGWGDPDQRLVPGLDYRNIMVGGLLKPQNLIPKACHCWAVVSPVPGAVVASTHHDLFRPDTIFYVRKRTDSGQVHPPLTCFPEVLVVMLGEAVWPCS